VDAETTSAADRRKDRRSMTVLRVAKLQSGSAEELAVVRNVSEGGICLFTDHEFEVGSPVSISLIEEMDVSGRVVWARDQFIGVEFDQDMPIEELLARPSTLKDGKRARFPRLNVDAKVVVRMSNRSIAARVRDISHKGAKLLLPEPPELQTQGLVVVVDDHTKLESIIRWSQGPVVGVEFLRPVSPNLLSHLVGMWKAK